MRREKEKEGKYNNREKERWREKEEKIDVQFYAFMLNKDGRTFTNNFNKLS